MKNKFNKLLVATTILLSFNSFAAPKVTSTDIGAEIDNSVLEMPVFSYACQEKETGEKIKLSLSMHSEDNGYSFMIVYENNVKTYLPNAYDSRYNALEAIMSVPDRNGKSVLVFMADGEQATLAYRANIYQCNYVGQIK